ncbi:PQQ-binding-like beta-propeller repeat protein [Streptomyces sp. NPDC058240]|uniref:PQQ-binding-like beta-propeller repeat protein n=1 Tax=Streptomyces sp. NPDC058240 TaxID=3346396 RepID=UPI0036EAA6B6
MSWSHSSAGEEWGRPGRATINSSPTVGDGVVYVGSDDRNVYARGTTIEAGRA